MKKIYLISAFFIFLIACNENALDFESDKNRVISELVRDTIFVTDSIYIVEEVVKIDTLIETIRDTVYLDKQKDFKQVYVDGTIAFSETYWNSSEQRFITLNEHYTESYLKNTFILDKTDSQSILHVNMDFTRTGKGNSNRDEWVFKIQVNSRYLNMDNINYLHPFGWNLGLLHYFNVITVTKEDTYYSKLDANNLMQIEFEKYYQDISRSKMKVTGVVLKKDRSPELNNFITFTLDIPIRIED